METNVEKSKEQKRSIVVERSVESAVKMERADFAKEVKEDSDNELDLDLDLGDTDEESEDESEEESVVKDEDEVKQEESENKPLTRQQKELRALKVQSKKKDARISELESKLADKKDSTKEEELASQYIEEGHDEKEARKRAKDDIKQTNIEQQLEMLLFEKKNRKVLSKYPSSEDDLEKIVKMSKTGMMTVEEICRGLYGKEVPAREKRAVDALLDESEGTEQNTSVSRSITSAGVPAKTKLTPREVRAKRQIELMHNNGVQMSEEDFLKIYPR